MDTRLVRRQGSIVIAVSGRLDMISAGTLEEELEAAIGGGDRRIALDLAGVEYLSSAGLRAILVAAKRLGDAGGTLVVIGLAGPVKEVFEMSGLGGVLPIYAGDAALFAAHPDWR